MQNSQIHQKNEYSSCKAAACMMRRFNIQIIQAIESSIIEENGRRDATPDISAKLRPVELSSKFQWLHGEHHFGNHGMSSVVQA